MKIIGIAGGSGSGKSSVTYSLVDEDPEQYEMLNFDDYHKWRTEPNLPTLHGMINWDHPDIINWQDLIDDLERLKQGEPITVQTWSHRSNVDYDTTRERIPRTVYPHPVLIVEGYMLLHDPDLRKLFDTTYYLELDELTRHARRDKINTVGFSEYNEKILKPMHWQYVEPTKALADHVIDIGSLSVPEIAAIIKNNL
jgi:uridine kinase